ncbi:MAG: DUF5050 domain-containing protein [Lachnospiraceae bacterium]|nr:DUF5050 domain-containing protein [Lachnospiraceae bacterium]
MSVKQIIIAISIVLLIVGAIIISRKLTKVKPLPEDTVGSTPGNLYNGGFFCEDEGVVYFSNEFDGGSLYSMNPDESNFKKLNVNPVSFICAGGDYLFYYQGSASSEGLGFLGHNTGIYRSKKNGKNTLALFKDPVQSMNLAGNYVYYQSFNRDKGLQFGRVRMDNKEKTKSGEDIRVDPFDCSCCVDGGFYFAGNTQDHSLHFFNLQTQTAGTVFEGNISFPTVRNGYVYYLKNTDNFRLYSRPLGSGEEMEQRLTEERVDCYNLVNDYYIYYQANSADNPALMRTTIDGGYSETILSGNYSNISSTDNFVYFRLFGKGPTAWYHHNLLTGEVSLFEPPVYIK